MGRSRSLFCLFSPFSRFNSNLKIKKWSVEAIVQLGIRTRVRSSSDRPKTNPFQLLKKVFQRSFPGRKSIAISNPSKVLLHFPLRNLTLPLSLAIEKPQRRGGCGLAKVTAQLLSMFKSSLAYGGKLNSNRACFIEQSKI